VGRDYSQATPISAQIDSEWLATHDPDFEVRCWGSARLRQAVLMANQVVVTVLAGGASIPGLECRLYEHDLVFDDPAALGIPDGSGGFTFTTDDDGDGEADTDQEGTVKVNGEPLAQGPESGLSTDYRIGVFVDADRIREIDVTVAPLLHGLSFAPDLLPSPPAKLDPYTDRVDVKIDDIPLVPPPWDDDEEGYGLLIRYLLATDVSGLGFTFGGIGSDTYTDTNGNGHWDPGEPLGTDDGDRSFDPAGSGSQTLDLAPEYMEAHSWWAPAKIKWEGYCGLTEEADQIAEFPDEAEHPGGPGYAPGNVVKEGRYMLHIEMQHKDWPSQVQRYQIDFAVQYAY
jgi:hypothetical protein